VSDVTASWLFMLEKYMFGRQSWSVWLQCPDARLEYYQDCAKPERLAVTWQRF